MLVLFTIYTIKRKKIISNYVLIFNIWWLFWLLISFLNLGNFYAIDLKTYLYIYAGLFSFNITILIRKKNSSKEYNYVKPYLLTILLVIEIVYLFINIFYFYKMSNTVNMFEEYWKVRFVYFGIPIDNITITLFNTSISGHIYNAFKMFNLINFLISLTELESKNSKRFILVVVNMFLFSLFSAGREFINYIIIVSIYAFKKKLISKYFKFILIMCLVVLMMTYLREGSLSKVYMALITYFSGSISYFDYLMKVDDGIRYTGELLLSSVIAPAKMVLRFLGVSIGNSGMSDVGMKLMKMVKLSDTNSFTNYYNALATSFYWQFKDFGLAGIIGINFSIGLLYNYLYRTIKGDYGIVLFSYLEFLMILSIFSFKFMDLYSVFPIILIILLIKYNGETMKDIK